jgi:hypothetical protein
MGSKLKWFIGLSVLGAAVFGLQRLTVNFVDKQCYANRVDAEVAFMRKGKYDPVGLERAAIRKAVAILESVKGGASMCHPTTTRGRLLALQRMIRGDWKVQKRLTIIGCVTNRAWAGEYSEEVIADSRKPRKLRQWWHDVRTPPDEKSCAAYKT